MLTRKILEAQANIQAQQTNIKDTQQLIQSDYVKDPNFPKRAIGLACNKRLVDSYLKVKIISIQYAQMVDDGVFGMKMVELG